MENENVKTRRSGLSALLITALFTAAALIAALTSKIVTADVLYAPVTPDYTAVSAADSMSLIATSGRSAAIQMLAIFIGGFTFFSPAISAIILSYRGVCLGYTAAAIASGYVEHCKASFLGISGDVMVPVLYFAATIPMIVLSSVSISFAKATRDNEANVRHRNARYFLLFMLMSGITALTSVSISFIS